MSGLRALLLAGLTLLPFAAAACAAAGEGSAPDDSTVDLVIPDGSEPLRPGCGDYRLFVDITSDALEAGMQVSGPAGVIALPTNLSGPNLVNDDNRGLFGFDGNEDHQRLQAHFSLLVSGLPKGQQLTFDAGQNEPGAEGTTVSVYNALAGLDDREHLLVQKTLGEGIEQLTVDLCAAAPMPALPPRDAKAAPRILAFYYPWFGTLAEPGEGIDCGHDASGWFVEAEGGILWSTAHSPIRRDGDRVIYRQTACWQEVTDREGRRGEIYSVNHRAFLGEQMAVAAAHGIDGFLVSVHGDNTYEMDFLVDRALKEAEKASFLVGALYEAPEQGWSEDPEANRRLVADHLAAILRRAAPSSAYLRRADGGQAAIFIDPAVLVRLWRPTDWRAIRRTLDETDIPYALLAGPSLFAYVFDLGFEGIFNDLEVIETLEAPLDLEPYALRDERRLAYRGAAWAARQAQQLLVLPVVPGWESAPVRGRSDQLTRDYGASGDWGLYFRTRWEDALEARPDWIVLTSWNEWAEGTEIEASATYPPSRHDYLDDVRRYGQFWRDTLTRR